MTLMQSFTLMTEEIYFSMMCISTGIIYRRNVMDEEVNP
uniref:Uncharacterized protein n=1 Tax=Heterorhabditis bacteriophora TaxID=37862 RepID=A0A1I7X1D0_HETBA